MQFMLMINEDESAYEGEGGAALVLEDWDHAVARGARIQGEIVGYGASCDRSHLVRPDAQGQARALQAALRDAELTPDDINALWMSVQAQSLGDAFEFMDGYETFWAYIPHFVHSPFYVYAYAFGDGLVNALYAAYADGLPDFQEKYFAMLKAGGSMHHKDLLAPFGLDASDPKFWDKGLSMIAGFIDELEAMEA